MSDDPKCVAGCVPFYGGEKRHHKDCPYYPESLTKLNADRIEELEAKLAKAVEALEGLIELLSLSTNEINPKSVLEFAHATLAELKGKTDE